MGGTRDFVLSLRAPLACFVFCYGLFRTNNEAIIWYPAGSTEPGTV